MSNSMLQMASRYAAGGIEDEKDYLLGCIAVRRDGAIVCSRNLRTEQPNPMVHAEYRVLRKAGWGATLWVARVTRDNKWAMAKPCKKCQAIIKSKGVQKVYYTISENEFGVWHPNRKNKQ